MKNRYTLLIILYVLAILFAVNTFAGLPPTTSKLSSDSGNVTTFNYQFPNFTGTHTGSTVSLGVNAIAGGGTNNGSLAVTAGGSLYTDGSKVMNTGATQATGYVLGSNGSSAPSYINSTKVGNVKNYVVNGDAETTDTTTGITDASGILTRNTTLPLVGSGDYLLTPTASGQKVKFLSNAKDVAFQAGTCESFFWYKASAASFKAYVEDNSGNKLSQDYPLAIQTSSNSFPVTMYYPCDSTTNYVVFESTASSGAINADNISDGGPVHLGNIPPSAQQIGSISVSCSGSPWNTSATTLSAYSAISGCTYTTSGQALQPSTNIPGIKLASVQPGSYMFVMSGPFGSATGGVAAYFRITDGTNFAKETATVNATSTATLAPSITQHIDIANAASNVTFQVYGASDTGAGAPIFAGGGNQYLTITAYYIPTQAQTVISQSASTSVWSGTAISSGSWTLSSTSETDFSGSNTFTPTTINSSNFSTPTQSGTLPALSWIAPNQAIYQVCLTATYVVSSSAYAFQVKLTDASNSTLSNWVYTNSSSQVPFTVCAYQNASSAGASMTTKLRGLVSNASATGTLIGVMNWTITQLTGQIPAPILVDTKKNYIRVYQNFNQSISSGTLTLLGLNTIIEDQNNWFDISLSRFKPTIPGLFECTASAFINSNTNRWSLGMYLNSSTVVKDGYGSTGDSGASTTGLIRLNGTTDYIDVRVYTFSAGSTTVYGALANTYLDCHWVTY